MHEFQHTVSALSTLPHGWNPIASPRHNKRLVLKGRRVLTTEQRIELVLQETGAVDKAKLARWAETGTPQAMNQAIGRDSLSKGMARKLAKTTGASLAWLLDGVGEPFPDGPTRYPGAQINADGLVRLRQAEDAVDALSIVLAATLRTVASESAELGRALEASLAGLRGESGSMKQVIEGARAAVATGLQSSAPAARRAAPSGSSGKRPRTGR